MTVIAVVAVISGLNNYVATKIFSLSPDVYAVTRWGIITSREEFLAALKRKPVEEVRGRRRSCASRRRADKIGAQSGTTQPRAATASRKLSDVQIQGTTANMAEIRNLDLEIGPLLHGDGERAPRVRRRHRLGRQGGALPARRPDRPHDHDRRDPVQGHRPPRQAGLRPRAEPGQRSSTSRARRSARRGARTGNIDDLRAGEGRRAGRARRRWTRCAPIFRALQAHGRRRRPTRSRS